MAEVFWAPVLWGYNEFPMVASFYDVQIDHLVDTLETAGF